MKYQLKITRSFKTDYKKLNKQETSDTDEIIRKLLDGSPLEDKNHDHDLTGNFKIEKIIFPLIIFHFLVHLSLLLRNLSRTEIALSHGGISKSGVSKKLKRFYAELKIDI